MDLYIFKEKNQTILLNGIFLDTCLKTQAITKKLFIWYFVRYSQLYQLLRQADFDVGQGRLLLIQNLFHFSLNSSLHVLDIYHHSFALFWYFLSLILYISTVWKLQWQHPPQRPPRTHLQTEYMRMYQSQLRICLISAMAIILIIFYL